MKKSSNLTIKLAKRIKEEFDIDVEPIIYRTYAGRWQKSRGTWSWFMNIKKSGFTVGSAFRATDVLKAKKLSICDDNEILVEE